MEARNLLIAEFRNNLDLNVRQETEEEIIESDDEDSFLPKKKLEQMKTLSKLLTIILGKIAKNSAY